MMFRLPNPIIALLCLFFLYYIVFTSPSPYSPGGDNSIDHASSDTVSPLLLPKPRKFRFFGRGNAIATSVIFFITLLNIIVYKLLQLQDANCGEKLCISSSSSSSSGELCRRFSLADILSATNNFDESLVIGRGGFGKVYKGVVDNGTTTVAIKRLNSLSKQGAPEFWTEIEMLSKFRHSHLVSLIGYCDIYNEMVLVYEYMPNGTVADHLHKFDTSGQKSPLSWVQRLKISIGAARGLDYLHTGTGVKHRVIHRDVKSSNILLDENWAAKISDFGLSKIGPADQSCTHVSTYVKGTCGYMDPEYLLTRRLTRKSDVYSFGVVLFEVLCGRPAMDRCLPEDQRGLARWAKLCIKEGTVDQMIDPNLRGLILPNCLSEFVHIASKCLHSRPKKRPTMTEVVGSLEYALALQERKDSSMFEEEEVFNAVGTYHYQEHVHSSIQQEVINADNSEHQGEKIDGILQLDNTNCGQSLPLPARQMTLKPSKLKMISQKVQFFFSVRPQVIPGRREKVAVANGEVEVEVENGGDHKDVIARPHGERRRSKPNPRLSNPTKNVHGEQVAAGWPSWLSAVAGEAINDWIPRRADTFEKIDKIGQGTYSDVYKARDTITGKIVALKKVRFDNLEPESVKFMAREILILRRLDHPNVVKLEGLVTSRMSCSLYLMFEYMDHDLAGLAASPVIKFTEPQVKCYMHQLLSGLEHCHNRHVLHRDIKGANLLLDNAGVLKIADFGMASFFDPNHTQPMTSRVVNLWYRPPELLLGATDYGVGVDLWSAGCILAELLAGKPIMPGRKEVEQLHKIFKLCGSPSEEYWKKSKIPHATIFKPQQSYRRCITETFKDFPPSSLPLIETLLAIDPSQRQTATAALSSEFFTTQPHACDPSSLPKYPPSKEMDAKLRDEESRRQRAAGKANADSVRKARTRDRVAVRAFPAPEANAELQANLDRRRLITHANAKSKSEQFPPPHQDGTFGYPLGSSHHIDPPFDPPDVPFSSTNFTYSKERIQTWPGPLLDPAAVGALRGKNT